MKKIKIIINKILITISISLVFILSGCEYIENFFGNKCDHEYYYKYTESSHYLICKKCKEKLEEEPHNLLTHEKKDATCTQDGYLEYVTCDICGYSNYQAIYKTGHTFENSFSYDDTYHFYKASCGCDETKDKKEHDYEISIISYPTHNETGETLYSCKYCDYQKTVTTPILTTHVYNQKVENNSHLKSEATCTNKATYYYSCICGENGNLSFESGSIKSHDLESHLGKAATCTENGYKAYDTCKNCNYSTYEIIPKLGHLFTNYVSNGDGTKSAICDRLSCNEINTINEDLNSITLSTNDTITGSSITKLDYNFYIFNYSNSSNNLLTLDKNGYISNKNGFYNIDTITVVFNTVECNKTLDQYKYGFGQLYYATDNHYIDNPFSFSKDDSNVIESGVPIDLTETNENYFSIYSNNTFNIEQIVITYQAGIYQEEKDNFTINVITTNDIHGALEDTSNTVGLNKLSGKINSLKYSDSKQYNILLDQGDIYEGTAESYYTHGYLMDDYLMINGYDSIVLGNHEWSNGIEEILDHLEYLDIPVLANDVRNLDGSRISGLDDYKIIERGGVKIGLIGSMGDSYTSITQSLRDQYSFKYSEGEQAFINKVKQDAITLKNNGCQFIILQVHDDLDVSSQIYEYVDLILEGHTHSGYIKSNTYNGKTIYEVQNAGYLGTASSNIDSIISSITISVEYVNGNYKFTVNQPTNYKENTIYSSNDESKYMKEAQTYYLENYYGEKCEEIVAVGMPSTSSSTLGEYAAVEYYNAKELLKNTEYASYIDKVVLGGAFLKERNYNNLSGTVTYADIFIYYPFDNDIQLCSITGRKLKERFLTEQTNYHVYPDRTSFTKSNYKDNEIYYIISDSYSSDYSYNGLTVICNIGDEFYPRDLLANYLRKNYLSEEIINNSSYLTGAIGPTFFVNNSHNVVATSVLNESINISINYTGVTENTSYANEININKNGTITIDVGSGYHIKEATINIYQTYDNLNFYDSDSSNSTPIEESFVTGNKSATYTVSSGRYLTIKNDSNYTVYMYTMSIIVEED